MHFIKLNFTDILLLNSSSTRDRNVEGNMENLRENDKVLPPPAEERKEHLSFSNTTKNLRKQLNLKLMKMHIYIFFGTDAVF